LFMNLAVDDTSCSTRIGGEGAGGNVNFDDVIYFYTYYYKACDVLPPPMRSTKTACRTITYNETALFMD
jgi:hypothetical protein